MQNPRRNWRLYRLAKACSCRPSELLGLNNSYAAYCLDEAVIYFGEMLDQALEEAAEGAKNAKVAHAKQMLVFEAWLNTPEEHQKNGTSSKGAFRSPALTK